MFNESPPEKKVKLSQAPMFLSSIGENSTGNSCEIPSGSNEIRNAKIVHKKPAGMFKTNAPSQMRIRQDQNIVNFDYATPPQTTISRKSSPPRQNVMTS